jgi:hypothetical protein
MSMAPARAARERYRPSAAARGYGGEHRRRALALRTRSQLDHAPCMLCDQPIDYALRAPHPLSFAAHHTTPDKLGPMVPSHRVCNERAGRPD